MATCPSAAAPVLDVRSLRGGGPMKSSPLLVELATNPPDDRVVCAGCAVVFGRWVGGVVVNATGRTVPRWCSSRDGSNAVSVGRLRAHGPWLPV